MSAKSEDQIILKLLLKGQSETEIIAHLQAHGMIDEVSKYRVQDKVREMRAAQAFLPRHPPRKRIRLFAVLLIILGGSVTYFFWVNSLSIGGGSNPSGYAFWLIVIGVVLFLWPDKGTERL